MTTYEWKPGDVAEIFDEHEHVWVRALAAAESQVPEQTFWQASTGERYNMDVRARPVFTLDQRDPLAVEALRSAVAAQPMTQNVALEAVESAIESLLPTPIRHSCHAHGLESCPTCSRIRSEDFDYTGECKHCSVYGTTGMHWDACPGRQPGNMYANRDDAIVGIMLSARLGAGEQRLALARGALVATGFFTDDEVGDDIAAHIIEMHKIMASAGPMVRGMVVAAVLADDVAKPSPRRRFYHVGVGKWSEILPDGGLGSVRFAWNELDDVTQGSLDGIGVLRS